MGFLRDDAFWSATPTLLGAVISVTPVLLPSRPLPCKQFPLWLPRSPLLQHAVICHLSSTINHASNTCFGYHALRSCNMLSSAIYHLPYTVLAALLCCIIIRDVCLLLHRHMGCLLPSAFPWVGGLWRVLLPSMMQEQVVKTKTTQPAIRLPPRRRILVC